MRYLVWGTGGYADLFCDVLGKYIQIAGYVETIPQGALFRQKKVYSPYEIKDVCYDYILVVNTHYEEIRDFCKENNLGIADKLINVFKTRVGIKENDGGLEMDFVEGDIKTSSLYWTENLLCVCNRTIFEMITSGKSFSDWWCDKERNVIFTTSNQLEQNAQDMICKWLIPNLESGCELLDIGCSNGEIDELIAPYVKNIDAYDYSRDSINIARERATIKAINNVKYMVGDAKVLAIEKKYDVIMMLGVSIYFDDDDELVKLAKKMYMALKERGIVLLRSTVQTMEKESIYHYNFFNDYQACYRSKERYEKIWKDAGFTIIKEDIMANDVNIGVVLKNTVGYLLKK